LMYVLVVVRAMTRELIIKARYGSVRVLTDLGDNSFSYLPMRTSRRL
jgi:hypothetical protein